MSKVLQSHWWATLFVFAFPLLVMYGYSDFIRSSELNARLGWILLIGGVAYLFRHTVLQKLLLGVLFLFVLSGSLDILYAVTFGGVFTSASFEAMALTDVNESWEFLLAYASIENILLLLFYWVVAFYSLKRILFKAPIHRREKVFAALGVLMILVSIQQIHQRGRTFDVLPGFTGVAIDFSSGHESIEVDIQARQQLYQTKPFVAHKKSEEPQTYVIIIGESVNRNHLQLYGYTRETSPNLIQNQADLIVFDDVISPFAQTRPSLNVALTEADTVNKMSVQQAISLLGGVKKAGFKTWWISNQQPLRRPTSAMASLADVPHFISNDFYGVEVNRYDGYLLPSIQKAIADDAPHKVIFVHMMGSHLQYRNRYPPEQAVFEGQEGIQAYRPNPSRSELAFINSYDDSVRYTDAILGEILASLNRVEGVAALSFFADHGEEVFDSKDFKGHGPDGVTRHMVEIPFVFWRNEAYQSAFKATDVQLQQATNSPMMLDDYFHFGLCFMQVESDLLSKQRGLCFEEYEPKPRIIYGKDYDKEIR
ncbi:MAG: phosphoethanolamine transferase [Thiomicrorhabdus sp.]|nr:phosphoethanolamine transferase [Thiomicrorhabdus sp.]